MLVNFSYIINLLTNCNDGIIIGNGSHIREREKVMQLKTDITRKYYTSGFGKVFAGIIGIMMFFVILVSACYIAAEACHVCCEDDCPICACIQICENMLQKTGYGIVFSAQVVLAVVFLCLFTRVFVSDTLRETPVSKKVRLNN